jgi:anthranilate synthase component 1
VVPDLPFSGGLVGVGAYDLVRHFERLPNAPVHPDNPQGPEAAYLAAESLLVFDHLTRRIALLHAGSEAERLKLRAEVIRLLRGALPAAAAAGTHSAARQSLSREQFIQAVEASKKSITGRCYQLVLSVQFTGTHSLP